MKKTLLNKFFTKKIVSVAFVFITLLMIGGFLTWQSTKVIKASDLKITNLSANQATITFVTSKPTSPKLLLKSTPDINGLTFLNLSGITPYYDDRDILQIEDGSYKLEKENNRYTHHITVRDLEPNTKYYFALTDSVFAQKLEIDQIKTLEVDENSEQTVKPEVITGEIRGLDTDSIVFIKASNEETSEEIIKSSVVENYTYSSDFNSFKNIAKDARELLVSVVEKNNFLGEYSFVEPSIAPLETFEKSSLESDVSVALKEENTSKSDNQTNTKYMTLSDYKSRCRLGDAYNTSTTVVYGKELKEKRGELIYDFSKPHLNTDKAFNPSLTIVAENAKAKFKVKSCNLFSINGNMVVGTGISVLKSVDAVFAEIDAPISGYVRLTPQTVFDGLSTASNISENQITEQKCQGTKKMKVKATVNFRSTNTKNEVNIITKIPKDTVLDTFADRAILDSDPSTGSLWRCAAYEVKGTKYSGYILDSLLLENFEEEVETVNTAMPSLSSMVNTISQTSLPECIEDPSNKSYFMAVDLKPNPCANIKDITRLFEDTTLESILGEDLYRQVSTRASNPVDLIRWDSQAFFRKNDNNSFSFEGKIEIYSSVNNPKSFSDGESLKNTFTTVVINSSNGYITYNEIINHIKPYIIEAVKQANVETFVALRREQVLENLARPRIDGLENAMEELKNYYFNVVAAECAGLDIRTIYNTSFSDGVFSFDLYSGNESEAYFSTKYRENDNSVYITEAKEGLNTLFYNDVRGYEYLSINYRDGDEDKNLKIDSLKNYFNFHDLYGKAFGTKPCVYLDDRATFRINLNPYKELSDSNKVMIKAKAVKCDESEECTKARIDELISFQEDFYSKSFDKLISEFCGFKVESSISVDKDLNTILFTINNNVKDFIREPISSSDPESNRGDVYEEIDFGYEQNANYYFFYNYFLYDSPNYFEKQFSYSLKDCFYSWNTSIDKNSNLLKILPILLPKKILAQAEPPKPNEIDFEKLESGEYLLEVTGFENANFNVSEEGISVKFYEDVNGNGKKDENEIELNLKQFDVKLSKIKELNIYSIETGWSLLGFPVYDSSISKASSLISRAFDEGVIIEQISKYSNGEWVNYVSKNVDGTFKAYGPDFSIIPGESYFVRSTLGGNFRVYGNTFAESVPVYLKSTWNLVSIQSPEIYTAGSLLQKCVTDGFECEGIYKFENDSFEGFILNEGETFGLDFEIQNTKGYFIKVKKSNSLDKLVP